MFCHAGPISIAFLVGYLILTDSDLQIQISKNGLLLKLKVHRLWRLNCDVTHDCS